MKLDLQIQGLDRVEATIKKLAGRQIREAAAKAVNDVAFQVRRDMQMEMGRVFDRPTPHVLSSVKVQQMAVPDGLLAIVAPSYQGSKQGAVDPQKVLVAEEKGGPRRLKKSEKALQHAGVLPQGMFTAMPRTPFRGSDDGRGNMRGPFVSMLLAYFKAYQPGGRRSNMTDRRREGMAAAGLARAGTVGGVAGVSFFVSTGQQVLVRGKPQVLPPGIWARVGLEGHHVRPVLMFVRAPNYKPRIASESILKAGRAQEYFERRMRYRIRQAAGV